MNYEEFENREDFLKKVSSYQLFFNLLRPNSYKENQTPWQIVLKKQQELPIEVAKIPPVFLDELLSKHLDFSLKGGHERDSIP